MFCPVLQRPKMERGGKSSQEMMCGAEEVESREGIERGQEEVWSGMCQGDRQEDVLDLFPHMHES